MDQQTQQLITEQFDKLPVPLQHAIQSVDYPTILQRLMTKHNLRVDKASMVENEITLALLGFEHPNDLLTNLQNHVHLSREQAQKLAQDIDSEIFTAVRNELKREWSKEEVEEEQAQEDVSSERRPVDTMPENVLKAKLETTVHTPTESESQVANSSAEKSVEYNESQDPYREPIE